MSSVEESLRTLEGMKTSELKAILNLVRTDIESFVGRIERIIKQKQDAWDAEKADREMKEYIRTHDRVRRVVHGKQNLIF